MPTRAFAYRSAVMPSRVMLPLIQNQKTPVLAASGGCWKPRASSSVPAIRGDAGGSAARACGAMGVPVASNASRHGTNARRDTIHALRLFMFLSLVFSFRYFFCIVIIASAKALPICAKVFALPK